MALATAAASASNATVACPVGNVTASDICAISKLYEFSNQTCSICSARADFAAGCGDLCTPEPTPCTSSLCSTRPEMAGCNESLCSPPALDMQCEGLLCLVRSSELEHLSPCGSSLCATSPGDSAALEASQQCTSALCAPESPSPADEGSNQCGDELCAPKADETCGVAELCAPTPPSPTCGLDALCSPPTSPVPDASGGSCGSSASDALCAPPPERPPLACLVSVFGAECPSPPPSAPPPSPPPPHPPVVPNRVMISRVSFTAVIPGTVEAFDREGFKEKLAASLRRGGAAVEPSMVELVVQPGSVKVTSIINDPPDVGKAMTTLASITASPAALSTALGGLPIASIDAPPAVETLPVSKPPLPPPSSPPPTPPSVPPPPWYWTKPTPSLPAAVSAEPPPPPDPRSDADSEAAQKADAGSPGRLSAGAIAGRIIGAVLFLPVLVVLGVLAVRNCASSSKTLEVDAVDVKLEVDEVSNTASGVLTSYADEEDAAAAS
jgi:hypothetical protein